MRGRRARAVSLSYAIEQLEKRVLFAALPQNAVLTFVTNTQDAATQPYIPGSLRAAIADVTSGAANTILFNIPANQANANGVYRIDLADNLPPINKTMFLDGYSQPGASPNTLAVGDNAVIKIQIHGVPRVSTSSMTFSTGSEGSVI